MHERGQKEFTSKFRIGSCALQGEESCGSGKFMRSTVERRIATTHSASEGRIVQGWMVKNALLTTNESPLAVLSITPVANHRATVIK